MFSNWIEIDCYVKDRQRDILRAVYGERARQLARAARSERASPQAKATERAPAAGPEGDAPKRRNPVLALAAIVRTWLL